jgi:hypothetical protein
VKHIIYECGICSAYHPWNWHGDCREDANRYAGPEDYAARIGVNQSDVEGRTMAERVAADRGEPICANCSQLAEDHLSPERLCPPEFRSWWPEFSYWSPVQVTVGGAE